MRVAESGGLCFGKVGFGGGCWRGKELAETLCVRDLGAVPPQGSG